MKGPDALHTVPWRDLEHAYDDAADVPELILALYGSDDAAADDARHALFGTIVHQGTVHFASAPAVPFLAHAALHAPGRRADVLMLLAALAEHDPADTEEPSWKGSAVADTCAELCRETPALLPLLGDRDRRVRRVAIRAVAAVADLLPDGPRASATARAEELYESDPVPGVRADAVILLSRFGRDLAPLDSPLGDVRLAAAVLAAERSELPYPARLVEIIAQDSADPDPDTGDDDFPWGLATSAERLSRLLVRDPDLTVAARRIAAGDPGSCALPLLQRVAGRWRDRDAEVMRLLLVAPPRRGAPPHDTARRLGVIGDLIARVPEPAEDIRDALHRRTSARDATTAAAALVALARARDPRAVDLVLERPTAQALRAAAVHFPQGADRLIPVIRRELAAPARGVTAVALIEALAPFGAAARQARPEPLDCLRTRRAADLAARSLGLVGEATEETVALLHDAMRSTERPLRAAAAGAHHRLTGDAGPALDVFGDLLARGHPVHPVLVDLRPLGPAAAPLLPLVEPLLTARYEWNRVRAAEAYHALTGDIARAVSVLTELAGPTPFGLQALKTLAAIGQIPDELRAPLRIWASSPYRLLDDPLLPVEGPHPDDELLSLARDMLGAG
ncbi:hypothetical protein [Streptomyces avicenniae]|uniref:hypothetical protein n=1 Tax=Streptomyces avicenniae TaxID=500153 RepID=UPI000699F32A|nr:hypothetical protein [Streptomyces avicenniae]